jgi:hypothetical protein
METKETKEMKETYKKESIIEVLQKLPPNYPVSFVYLNGVLVSVSTFVNLSYDLETVYFLNGSGQLLLLDASTIDGISFVGTEAGC